MTNVQLCLLLISQKGWFQLNSRMDRTHFASAMTLNKFRNDCRNAKLHFQITFSLLSTSSLFKLPSDNVKTVIK